MIFAFRVQGRAGTPEKGAREKHGFDAPAVRSPARAPLLTRPHFMIRVERRRRCWRGQRGLDSASSVLSKAPPGRYASERACRARSDVILVDDPGGCGTTGVDEVLQVTDVPRQRGREGISIALGSKADVTLAVRLRDSWKKCVARNSIYSRRADQRGSRQSGDDVER